MIANETHTHQKSSNGNANYSRPQNNFATKKCPCCIVRYKRLKHDKKSNNLERKKNLIHDKNNTQ